jgi:hypothetical protein
MRIAHKKRGRAIEFWQANYKAMSFDQLLKVRLPIGLNSKGREERMAFIAAELQIKAPAHDSSALDLGDDGRAQHRERVGR